MANLEAVRAFRAVIDFFQWDLWAAYRAVATHVPDEYGDCTGCHTQRMATRFPCLVVTCAERAIELSR